MRRARTGVLTVAVVGAAAAAIASSTLDIELPGRSASYESPAPAAPRLVGPPSPVAGTSAVPGGAERAPATDVGSLRDERPLDPAPARPAPPSQRPTAPAAPREQDDAEDGRLLPGATDPVYKPDQIGGGKPGSGKPGSGKPDTKPDTKPGGEKPDEPGHGDGNGHGDSDGDGHGDGEHDRPDSPDKPDKHDKPDADGGSDGPDGR